ncbi:MAG: hypothetical protein AAB512_04370 [Patescibacteria group bacterium]
MPVSPVAGVPPLSTLHDFDRRISNFAPYYIAPGLTKKNFYRENGQIILASMVALTLLVFLFLTTSGVLASARPMSGEAIDSAMQLSPYAF